MDNYAVVGNPVSHSKSPRIHAMFAKQTGQSLDYRAIEAPVDSFAEVVKTFFAEGGKGLNVTVPFKEQAWALCQNLSDRAALAGAVNTLFVNHDGQLCGDNTDGIGLVNDLLQQGVALTGKNILIIGAGGAVKGIIQPILKEMPASLTVTNRTLSKAEALVRSFAGHVKTACPLSAIAIERPDAPYDLVINGTSASLGGELPQISSAIFSRNTVVYDMMYGKNDTVFNAWAKRCGAECVLDGLGMLVQQAAEAFFIWRGVRPETAEVIQFLRES
jgi:shikimate dehydrogenase